MSALDWIKENAEKARQGLAVEVAKYKNQDFLEATVAGCALVAGADGTISSDEKKKMIGFIQQSDELKVFNTDDVIAIFNRVVGKFEFDKDIGKAEALKIVAKLRSNPAAARAMVRVCCIIGSSDGTFDDREKAVVREICAELGLPAADFGL